MLAGEGTPISDHRASAAYRTAMLRESLRKFHAQNPATRHAPGGLTVMSKAHGPLADRPNNPKVGLEIPHESAALHVTGKALYTDDLVGRTKDVLHAWPLQAPHAHATITRLDVDAGLRGARRRPGADRRGRARSQRRRRSSTTSRCSPAR